MRDALKKRSGHRLQPVQYGMGNVEARMSAATIGGRRAI
jgi:hypothetical protein